MNLQENNNSVEDMGFIQKLISFLAGKPSDTQKPILKALQKQMAKSGYKYYNLKKEKILPDFARFLFTVYEAIAPLREFFLLRNEEAYYEDCVIKYFMSDKQIKMEELLTESSILELSKKMSFNDLRDHCLKALSTLKKEFNSEQISKIVAMNVSIGILRRFCTFDFYAMLRKFCFDLVENTFTEKYKFSAMSKEYFETEVTDLLQNFINFMYVEDWEDQFAFLETIITYKEFDRTKFNEMCTSLKKMEQDNVIKNFAKLYYHDSKYDLSASINKKDIVKPYVESYQQNLKSIIADVYAKKRSERIESLQLSLFGTNSIAQLKNYNKGFSDVLEAAKSPSKYTFCDQATYLHLFCETILSLVINSFFDIFAVRAVSPDSKYTSQMTSEFHAIIELDSTMVKLDTQLGESFPRGYKIINMLDNNGDPEILRKLEVEVNTVNAEFNKILTQALVLFHLLADKIKNLLLDANSTTHVLVKNWDDMDHYFSNPVLHTLNKISKNIEDFVALIDCYN